MNKLRKVFISHSHIDQELAAAFKHSLEKVFEECQVLFSSDKSVGSGIDPGSNWLAWIHEQVRLADETLVLLTPNSVQKAWPMWESGAVSGVALAREQINAGDSSSTLTTFPRNVKPVRFQILPEQLPGPFQNIQSTNGEDEGELGKLIGDLLIKYDHADTPTQGLVVESILSKEIPILRDKLRKALRNTPRLITEDIVQEWLKRLDDLKKDGRGSEVQYYHKWIRLMFDGPGYESINEDSLWDLRIHLRLGEMYHENKQFEQAIRQFELSRELAPLDLFVQHRLGMAYLSQKSFEKAKEIIDHILELDPEAAQTSAEIAGLVGRYSKDRAQRLEKENKKMAANDAYKEARDAYLVVLDRDPSSYYMADNVGQLSLKIGDKDRARRVYEQAEAALEGRKYESIWSLATAATAAIVLGNEDDAIDYLRL